MFGIMKTLIWPLTTYIMPNLKENIIRQSFIGIWDWADFFQGLQLELSFNILRRVIASLYEHIAEEIAW